MTTAPKLDRIDIKILAALQQDGRLSNVKLAETVGLSPSPCLQRVKRLEKAGYISGYRAAIDLGKVGSHITVFTEITLSDHRREDFVKFEAAIRKVEAVESCHLISGGYDYLVKFVTRDIQAYQALIESLLERNIGVAKYFSYVVIKSVTQQDAVNVTSLVHEQTTPGT